MYTANSKTALDPQETDVSEDTRWDITGSILHFLYIFQ